MWNYFKQKQTKILVGFLLLASVGAATFIVVGMNNNDNKETVATRQVDKEPKTDDTVKGSANDGYKEPQGVSESSEPVEEQDTTMVNPSVASAPMSFSTATVTNVVVELESAREETPIQVAKAEAPEEKIAVVDTSDKEEEKERNFEGAVSVPSLKDVNEEEEPSEDNLAGRYTVWVADERWETLRKVLTTNPTASAPWDQMTGKNADGVEVPIHLIATASSASYASEDLSKIVVEGCPDGRNTWTYIIDLIKHTAIQLPSTEGVQEIDMDKGEIIAASYGYYPEGGRYTVNKAYSLEGKFLRQASDPQPE